MAIVVLQPSPILEHIKNLTLVSLKNTLEAEQFIRTTSRFFQSVLALRNSQARWNLASLANFPWASTREKGQNFCMWLLEIARQPRRQPQHQPTRSME
jgi:hypothetical protein